MSLKEKIRKFSVPVTFFLLSFIHFISSFNLLEQSKLLRKFDQVDYLSSSFNLFLLPGETILKHLFQIDRRVCHPEFFTAIGALFWKFLNFFHQSPGQPLIILTTNIFFLFILLLAVYGIIKIIYQDKELALLGAFLISFTPIVYSFLRVYMLDLPLTSMVSLSVFLLLKTNDFKSLFFSLLAALAFFLSQNTRETSFLFILPVAVFYLVYSLKNNLEKRKIIFINFTIFLALFIFLSLALYFSHLDKCIGLYKGAVYEKEAGNEVYRGIEFLHYPASFFWIFFHPLFCFLLFTVFLGNLRKTKLMGKEIFLLVWLIFPLIVFSFFPNKTARFILPVIPAFLIFALGAVRNKGSLRKIFSILLVSVSIFQWAILTYSPASLNYSPILNKYRSERFLNLGMDRIGLPSIVDQSQEIGIYKKFVDDLIGTIEADHPKEVAIFSFFWFGKLRDTFLSARLAKKERNYWRLSLFPVRCEVAGRAGKYETLASYDKANYILYLEGDNPAGFCNERAELFNKLKDRLLADEVSDKLQFLKSVPLGKETVYIYRKSF